MSDSQQPLNGYQNTGNNEGGQPNAGLGAPTGYSGMAGSPQNVSNGDYGHHVADAKALRLSACGVAALVLGILGVILSFIPIVNNLAAILGAIGLVLGIIGMVGAFRGKKRGKVLTIIGTVLSVLAIVVTLMMQSATSKALDSASKGSSTTSSQSKSDANSSKSDSKSQSKPSSGEQDTEGDLKDAHVKIVSAVKSSNDYNNAETVLVTYQWENKTDKNQAFETLLNAKAFQNGQELDMAIYSQAPQGYDAQSPLAQLQPKAQGTVTVGYVLKDHSPVTVEITDLFSLDGGAKVKHVYNL